MKEVISRYEEVAWWGLDLGVIVGRILIAEQAEVIGRDWREIYRPATLSSDCINYATILSSPCTGAYSTLTIMAMPLPLWIYPILSLPLFTSLGYRLIALAPLALVLYPVARTLVNRFRKTGARADHFDEPARPDESKQASDSEP